MYLKKKYIRIKRTQYTFSIFLLFQHKRHLYFDHFWPHVTVLNEYKSQIARVVKSNLYFYVIRIKKMNINNEAKKNVYNV